MQALPVGADCHYYGLGDLEVYLFQTGLGNSLAGVQYLNTHNLVLLVKVEHNPGLHLLRFDNLGIIKTEVKRV